MPSAKISALTALDSTANLAQLYIPLFKADGSPDNPRILASDLLLAADGVNITPAWSGTGTATTPLLVNVTADPGPANAASKLLDLQVGGSSRVSVSKGASIQATTSSSNGASLTPTALEILQGSFAPGVLIGVDFNDIHGSGNATRGLAVLGATGYFGFTSGNASSSADVVVARDAADILALRRSTNANHFRVYETFTNSTDNFSRGVFGFRDASGSVPGTPVLRIGTEKGSLGGTARAVSIVTDGTERVQIPATGKLLVTGPIDSTTAIGNTSGSAGIGFFAAGASMTLRNAGVNTLMLHSTLISVQNGRILGFESSDSGAPDVALARPAANILGITNGSTGPGTLAIDNVQGTNLERLKAEWDTNVARIGTSKGGSGTARDFSIITDNTVRVTFAAAGGQTAADGHNMAFGTSTGTKIGTATGQKIGFWNATPVVQQVLATGAGATVDNVITLLQTLGLCKQS